MILTVSEPSVSTDLTLPRASVCGYFKSAESISCRHETH